MVYAEHNWVALTPLNCKARRRSLPTFFNFVTGASVVKQGFEVKWSKYEPVILDITTPAKLLFKGQRMKGEWVDALPPGSIAQMTSHGSTTTEAFVNWLTHFSHYKVAGSCLLVFDRVTPHLDHSLGEAAGCHDTTLLCPPSQTTHEMQPMDKSVFGPFEHYLDEQVLPYKAEIWQDFHWSMG